MSRELNKFAQVLQQLTSQVALLVKKKKKPACHCRRLKKHGFNPWMGDLLEVGIATYSNIIAWGVPWTEEPGRLQSMGLYMTEAT